MSLDLTSTVNFLACFLLEVASQYGVRQFHNIGLSMAGVTTELVTHATQSNRGTIFYHNPSTEQPGPLLAGCHIST